MNIIKVDGNVFLLVIECTVQYKKRVIPPKELDRPFVEDGYWQKKDSKKDPGR